MSRRIWIIPPIASGGPARNMPANLLEHGWRWAFETWVWPLVKAIQERGRKAGVMLHNPWGRPDATGSMDFDQQIELSVDPRCANLKDADLIEQCDLLEAAGVDRIAYIGLPTSQHDGVFYRVLDGAARLGHVGIDASAPEPVGSRAWLAKDYVLSKSREFWVERAPYPQESHWHPYPAIVRDLDGAREEFRRYANTRHLIIQERADTIEFLAESLTWPALDEPGIKTASGITPDQIREALPMADTIGSRLDAALGKRQQAVQTLANAKDQDAATKQELGGVVSELAELVKVLQGNDSVPGTGSPQ